jgi:hypothetical protein
MYQYILSSGFLLTYDVVGKPTTSSRYLPDVAYDVVGQDLRRRHTTSYVPYLRCRNLRCAYDVIKTYDVVRQNYNVVRYSSYAKS